MEQNHDSSGSNELVWHAKAAANILEAQKRKGRVGGRKSRRGCLTCKQRRIKCDEAHPSCRICTSSGRQCGGYAAVLSQKTTSNTLVGLHLSQKLGLQESDRRSFDFFLSWTSPRLGGAFDKDFWCRQVLQVAQVEPVILDSLLAISELYEDPQCLKGFRTETPQDKMALPADSVGASALGTGRPEAYTKSGNDFEPTITLDNRGVLAIEHYNRAIRGLMEKVASGRATLLVAVLSCVLFICVEFLRDNVFAALNLYTQGYSMLRQIDVSQDNVDNSLFISLKLTMTRLGILAAMYGHADLLEGRSMSGEINEETKFTSMSDARTALYVIMADSLAFHRTALPWKRLLMQRLTHDADKTSPIFFGHGSASEYTSDCVGDVLETTHGACHTSTALSEPDWVSLNADATCTPECEETLRSTFIVPMPSDDFVPEALLQQRAHFESRLLRWHDGLQRIEMKNEEAVSNLMMYYHASIILMASRLSLYESLHDEYTAHYEEIVRFAEIYYKCRIEQPSFTFEPGAIPILWMVVTKCRVPSLRRKALNLMKKAPKKECMWGRDSVAEFGIRVIAIEEAGMPHSASPNGADSTCFLEQLPPESSRIHELEIVKDVHGVDSSIRITRYLEGSQGSRMKSVEDYSI